MHESAKVALDEVIFLEMRERALKELIWPVQEV